MIGLGSPYWDWNRSLTCVTRRQPWSVTWSGVKKKKKVLERSYFRLEKDRRGEGRKGRKGFFDRWIFLLELREILVSWNDDSKIKVGVFFLGRKNSNKTVSMRFRCKTIPNTCTRALGEWKELIFFYGNFNTMFYTGKRCLITIKYAECVTNLAPHLYNDGNYY